MEDKQDDKRDKPYCGQDKTIRKPILAFYQPCRAFCHKVLGFAPNPDEIGSKKCGVR
ncbi:hypothetical protein [Haliscomenobacter sp.]|uniref:hypothetical protein n=1 Tax=Haliscomenobacter sp. TaxID=2717303 RepID=UPI003594603E